MLDARPYERVEQRRGYRNGNRQRTLTGPTGPVNLTIPRATMNTTGGHEEWRSTVVPRYQRRMREINEAVAGVYLSGCNTRRIKGALRPLLKEAPLSRSSVSRIVATFKGEMDAWRKQSPGRARRAREVGGQVLTEGTIIGRKCRLKSYPHGLVRLSILPRSVIR